MELGKIIKYEDYAIIKEPFYEEVKKEITTFEIAFHTQRPLALIGPTGCGKTQLTSYMGYKLRQNLISAQKDESTGKIKGTRVDRLDQAEKQSNGDIAFPYIEIPCHEDLSETYLIGRHGFNGEWIPGPLYIGATYGGIVVLDEMVEARKDVVVLLHPLTDDQRILPVTRKGEVIVPPKNFMVVSCYNEGYQIKAKQLKQSTKQRFKTIYMDYPPPDKEKRIVMRRVPDADEKVVNKFVQLAVEIRNAKGTNAIHLQEGASTRLLIMAAEDYAKRKELGLDLDLQEIALVNIINPIVSEDTDRRTLEEMLKAL